MKRLSTFSVFLIYSLLMLAQVHTRFSYYTVDEGLSENNVLCMLQDKKDNMWFGTYDGLNKFDGYNFKVYKGNADNKQKLLNYRIDRMKEDRDGYLWIQTYDGRTYRFDPALETFLPVPQCDGRYKNYKSALKGLYVLADGTVWITGGGYGVNNDCFRVENKADGSVSVTHFSLLAGSKPSSGKINKIHLDKSHNTWILTQNGLSIIRKHSSENIRLFKKSQGGALFSICETGNFIYIGGERGYMRVFDRRKGTSGTVKTPFLSDIIDIKDVGRNELFILTNNAGFYLYNIKTGGFTSFTRSAGCGIQSDNFYSCYKDRQNNIWLNSENDQVVYFETAQRRVNSFKVFGDRFTASMTALKFFVVEDNNGNIWVHPKTGGFSHYNARTRQLEPFYNAPTAADRKFSNVVRSAITDRQGNLWLCPNQGVVKVAFKPSLFSFTKPVPDVFFSEKNQVRALFQDQDNRLWVGTKDGCLYLFDARHKLIGRMGADGRLNTPVPFNAQVYHIISDHTGAIWLATKGDGIYRLNKLPGGGTAFSLKKYRHNSHDAYSLSSDAVYTMFEDHLKRLWVGTYGGGLNLIESLPDGGIRFINSQNTLRKMPAQCANVRFITEDKNKQILVGTTGGLVAFRADNTTPGSIRFYHYNFNPEDKEGLSGNDVHYILNARNGNLYLGIYGGGLNVLPGGLNVNQKPRFKVYTKAAGLPSDIIFTLYEDAKEQIWISSQTKIMKYNPQTEQFDLFNPVLANKYSFMEATVCQTRQGELIYGTTDGFVSFNPLKTVKSRFVPRISFTQLQVLNKPMIVGAEGSPLTRIIDETSRLTLSHKQNIISIGFAALDYGDPQNIQYAYKLEGVDADWNYVGSQRIATYTNLPKGKYTFKVKSTNADGVWLQNERRILIERQPSFWESAWGVLFYLCLLFLITVLTSYILFIIYKLKNDVAVEQRITNMKLRFFTDISHELRTPLTLIASPIENILRNESLSDNVQEQLSVVKRNTDRMLRLINQILDFRKIQNEKMKLLIEGVHVGTFVNDICRNFQKLAEERRIAFCVVDSTQDALLWVDKDKFEKIFYNLLSNAFKFTQSGNPIEVCVSEQADTVSITIKDSGAGIGNEMLKKLFNRFESLVSSDSPFQGGTGIGLALTKELVELHKASIEVESEPGKGTSFKVTFLKGHAHFGNTDEYILHDLTSDVTEVEPDVTAVADDVIREGEKPSVLIVEDNAELRNFLSSALRAHYYVHEAVNGKDALAVLPDLSPDLIISDIMMPEMSGLELAKAIRDDLSVSHIPLVLLTAKDDIESKLQAMEYGADDYITKPFSSAYLEARIENLLKQRQQLQEYYRASLTSGVISVSKPNVTSQDDVFIQRVMKYVEENIDDSELSIDGIAAFIGMSRSSMFKKIKSLTGLAPVDFLKEVRLQRAAQLIETEEFNVSQVAYMVGLNDPRYFSKCFKMKFGVSPSEYNKKKG